MASARWERRNAAARALGYKSYYDYRSHNQGKIAPDQPRASGELLGKLRGHRGPSDLESLLAKGRVEILMQFPIGDRNPDTGQYRQVEVQAILTDGTQRTFTLRGKQLDASRLRGLRRAIADAGVKPLTSPSLDILKLLPGDLDDEEPFDDEAHGDADDEAA
jgi:hypothetical protein